MENITTGHWIFAGIAILAFVVYLIWSYRKELPKYRPHYGNTSRILIGIIVVLFLFYIFKRLF